MSRFVFFFIAFISSFSNSWGNYTEDDIKKIWADTNYNFEFLFETLNADYCYQSRRKFTACLMAFNELLASISRNGQEGEFYELRVSDTDKLKIVPFSKKELQEPENLLAWKKKRRESFTHLESLPHVQEFNNLVQQIIELTKEIPQKDQSYMAGMTYDFYLKEAFDPYSGFYPLALHTLRPHEFFGIGALTQLYRTKNGMTGLVVDPHEGSLAEASGLKKGDLILGINDFDITGLAINSKTMNDLSNRIRGPEGTQVRLKIQSVCDNGDHEKEIVVTRGYTSYFPNWLNDNRFVNLTEQETSDCETKEQAITTSLYTASRSKQDGSMVAYPVPDSVSGPRALYVPLKAFEAIGGGPFYRMEHPLCHEFLVLQKFEMSDPYSRGMIIDLRGNPGGFLREAACMLNTVIESNDVIVRSLPLREGKLLKKADGIKVWTYYFTDGGFHVDPSSSPFIYNKNIVVLVDENSISASEIFAGTIQEMKRGWVVGRRTFGKGTIQKPLTPYTLFDGKPLQISVTMGVYTLNSGRSPQGYGIIPDFHVSRTGEPVGKNSDDVSPEDQTFFNNIQLENSQWTQNRSEELAQLSECVNKEGRLGKALREKIQEDERHGRPYIGDYSLELAKDILMCAPPRSDRILPSYLSPPYLKKMETIE